MYGYRFNRSLQSHANILEHVVSINVYEFLLKNKSDCFYVEDDLYQENNTMVFQKTHYSNTVSVLIFLYCFVPEMLDVSGELHVPCNSARSVMI